MPTNEATATTPGERRPGRQRGCLARTLHAALFAALFIATPIFTAGRFASGEYGALTNPWAYQLWLLFGGVALAALVLRTWRTAGFAAFMLMWSSFIVVPSLVPRSPAPATGPRLRLLSANVLASNPPSREALAWIDALDADVVGIVECSPAWAEAARALTGVRSYSVTLPHPSPRGIALFSRHPLRDVQTGLAPSGAFPYIDAVVDAPGGAVRVLLVHPVPPMSTELVERRNAEIEWLAARAALGALPTIVAGDFNEAPYGLAYSTFRTLSGLRSARDGFGRCPTWPSMMNGSDVPAIARIAIDHCWVSKEIGVAAFDVGPHIGSDHRPIVVDLRVSTASLLPSAPPATR